MLTCHLYFCSVGIILKRQGEHKAALEMHHKALSILERVHGQNHPDVANVLYEIATDHCLGANLPAALSSFEAAVRAGLHSVSGIQESDSDLDAIRDDARFKNLTN